MRGPVDNLKRAVMLAKQAGLEYWRGLIPAPCFSIFDF